MDYPYYFNLNPNWSAYAPVPMPVPSAIQQNTPSSNNQMISSQNGTELEEVSSQGKQQKGNHTKHGRKMKRSQEKSSVRS